jgi:hypothetical protein
LSSMSVLVLDDLCFSLRSLPPKEAIVPVVSNDIFASCVWYRNRFGEELDANGRRRGLRSFVSCLIGDVVLGLVRGHNGQLFPRATPPFPWILARCRSRIRTEAEGVGKSGNSVGIRGIHTRSHSETPFAENIPIYYQKNSMPMQPLSSTHVKSSSHVQSS